MFSTLGVLSTVVGVQYRGGYHDACGGILSTMGCSVSWHDKCKGISRVPWGCSIPWEVIFSTVGDTQYHGGYNDALEEIS